MEKRAEGQHHDTAGRQQIVELLEEGAGIADMLQCLMRQDHVVPLIGSPVVNVLADEIDPLGEAKLLGPQPPALDIPGHHVDAGDVSASGLGERQRHVARPAAHIEVAQLRADRQSAVQPKSISLSRRAIARLISISASRDAASSISSSVFRQREWVNGRRIA